jgi:hypothetical protein
VSAPLLANHNYFDSVWSAKLITARTRHYLNTCSILALYCISHYTQRFSFNLSLASSSVCGIFFLWYVIIRINNYYNICLPFYVCIRQIVPSVSIKGPHIIKVIQFQQTGCYYAFCDILLKTNQVYKID